VLNANFSLVTIGSIGTGHS